MRRTDNMDHVEIVPGVYYGGSGPGGEYYYIDCDNDETESIWVRDEKMQIWTPEILEAIVTDMRTRHPSTTMAKK